MKKQASVVILVLLLAVAVLGCRQSQTADLKRSVTVKSESEVPIATPQSKNCTMSVYFIAAEGQGQITGILDSITGKIATKDKPIDDRVRITGGDMDDIPRVAEIFATEKSNYKVFLKGKSKKKLSADITIEVVGGKSFPNEKHTIRLDGKGKGWIQIDLTPDLKKYEIKVSKEAK